MSFDTVKYTFTYQYQKLLEENDRVILSRFKLTNLEKVDTTYFVSIVKGYSRKIFIDFKCTKEQAEELFSSNLESKTGRISTHNKYLILKINTVKKIKFMLDNEFVDNGTDFMASILELETSNSFIFEGDLIEIHKN